MKRMLSSKKAHSIGLIMILSVMVSMATACSNEADNTVAPTQTTTPPTQTAAESTPGTIVEIAAGDSSFSTLVTAVKAAGLAETLSGEGPFTVFAPTDEAFAALPEGTLDNLLKPENRDSLRKVLTYHVVSGDLMAKDLNSGQVATVEGSSLEVQVSSNGVKVNNANVAKADIDATNGVIHVIDSVLLPPGL